MGNGRRVRPCRRDVTILIEKMHRRSFAGGLIYFRIGGLLYGNARFLECAVLYFLYVTGLRTAASSCELLRGERLSVVAPLDFG